MIVIALITAFFVGISPPTATAKDNHANSVVLLADNSTPTATAGAATTQQDTAVKTPIILNSETTKDDEIPAAGAPWYEWILYIIGLFTAGGLLRAFLLRYLPTAINIDFIDKLFEIIKTLILGIVDLINIASGKWTSNRARDGGTHE